MGVTCTMLQQVKPLWVGLLLPGFAECLKYLTNTLRYFSRGRFPLFFLPF